MILYLFLVFIKILFIIKRPWTVIVSRVINQPLHKIFELKSGEKFFLRKNMNADLSMMAEVFFDHYYDPPFFEIHDNSIVFDVGAHVGYFTVYAAKRAKEVHSFEPFHKNNEMLVQNIALNNFKNVHINNIALGGEDGNVNFYEHKDHTGCHSLYQREGTKSSHIVPKQSLKNYMDTHNITFIDLLKLDCEGAEYDIISQTPDEYLLKIKAICMEIHENITNIPASTLIYKLKKLGFKVSQPDFNKGFIYAIKF